MGACQKVRMYALTFGAVAAMAVLMPLFVPPAARAEPAAAWTDAETGHKVVRISRESDVTSLYFYRNAFTPAGDRMVVQTPNGISVVDVGTWDMRLLLNQPGANLLFTGRRTRRAFFATRARDDAGGPFSIMAVDIDSGKVTKVADVSGGTVASINSDETLLVGMVTLAPGKVNPDGTLKAVGQGETVRPGMNLYAENRTDGTPYTYAEAKERAMHRRRTAGLPMELFTIDLRTGKRRVVLRSTEWLNHAQFSPTDPMQIMYCHEGPWHEVDRIWTVRADGKGNQPVHHRTMNLEITGHEFFAPDGQTIWYDLQMPRGEVFWLAGLNLKSGARQWYKVERDQWSVHYMQSPDGTMFVGDGGDAGMVARARDGKYLYLLRPRLLPDIADLRADNAASLIKPGLLDGERLVNMRRQDYRLEPNARFTPDGRWVIFRGNFEGATHLYAVEVTKRP